MKGANRMEKQIINQKDGKEMLLIEGGSFVMGSDNGYSEEGPGHRVQVDGFYMDRYPVTNAEFKAFCDATGRGYPASPRWSDMPGYFLNYPDHPVINVSFDAAAAYAEWAGKRLPTEQEWEYAAAGGLSSPTYPWGNEEVDGERANFADRCSDLQWQSHGVSDGYKYTSPVGSYPANGYGLYDMAGNVFEWVDGWFYRYDDEVRDTAKLSDGWGGYRVCRGGCYHSVPYDLRITRRRQVLGGGDNQSVGFRCVRDLVPVPAPEKPDDSAERAAAAERKEELRRFMLSRNIRMPEGQELCCGCGLIDDETAELLHAIGFTSVEQYVTWESCENAGEGIWDFDKWDKQVEILGRHGLKWLPFIIAGPAYSLPDWYRESTEFHGIVCLEHNIESKIQTFWDKNFNNRVDRFLKKFAEHYSDVSIFEGLLFGISGDFGESIVSVWHGNWPLGIPGIYHAHSGYWCNDRFARRDFVKKMGEKFGTVEALNEAWGTDFPTLAAVTMPPVVTDHENFRIDEQTEAGRFAVKNAADRRRWVDFVDWYRGSMNEYASFWMKTARKYFPETELYLCTGGDAVPWHASEFAAQSKLCAEVSTPAAKGGVRITNEASDYRANFAVTDWVATASEFYGGVFSFEPAGQVTERGVVCRVYNAAATGAKSLHFYESNLAGSVERIDNFSKNIKYLSEGGISRDVGVLYPDVPMMFDEDMPMKLEPSFNGFVHNTLGELRDFADYSFVCDLTAKDGILDRLKALIIIKGGCYRRKTLEKIVGFVQNGGAVIGLGIGGLTDLEKEEDFMPLIFGSDMAVNLDMTGKDITSVAPEMAEFLRRRGVSVPDGEIDGVYVAEKYGKLLCMNYSGRDLEKTLYFPDGEVKTVLIPDLAIEEY